MSKGFIKDFKPTVIHFYENNQVDISLRFGCNLMVEKKEKEFVKHRTILGDFDIKAALNYTMFNQKNDSLYFMIKIRELKVNELKVFKSSKEAPIESLSTKLFFENNINFIDYIINFMQMGHPLNYDDINWLGGDLKLGGPPKTTNGYLELKFNLSPIEIGSNCNKTKRMPEFFDFNNFKDTDPMLKEFIMNSNPMFAQMSKKIKENVKDDLDYIKEDL